MSKQSRTHAPTPNKEIRVTLTPREFADLQGTCAIAALALQVIRQQTADAVAAAQKPQQLAMARLAKKYKAQGMRADCNYRFDVEAHALVSVPETP